MELGKSKERCWREMSIFARVLEGGGGDCMNLVHFGATMRPLSGVVWALILYYLLSFTLLPSGGYS